MKKVFSNNSEVCHIWASQTQSEGSANNIFFENKSIFSYGKHFEIARFFDNCVLFTSKNYSVSTAKHKGEVKRAISHKKVFTVYSVEGNHEKNIEYYQNEIKENVCKALKASRNAEYYKNNAVNMQKELLEYCKEFDLLKKTCPKISKNSLFSNAELLKIKEKTAKAEKQREVKRENQRKLWELREKERLLDLSEKIALWKKGELKTSLPYNAPTMLRIKENTIETSKGANVPLSEGIALFKAIKQGNSVIGAKVGIYTVDAVESDIVKIGCHNIPLKEAERIFANV